MDPDAEKNKKAEKKEATERQGVEPALRAELEEAKKREQLLSDEVARLKKEEAKNGPASALAQQPAAAPQQV